MTPTLAVERPSGRDRADASDRARTVLRADPDDADAPDAPDGPGSPGGGPNADRRTVRARTEPMAVHPLRDDEAYLVDTEGGSYVVDPARERCDCPDNEIRGKRCKHLRRVELEVGIGRVPAPGERVAACAVCGGGVFVPVRETGAFLCGDHRPAVGSFVRDRETGKLLVVVRVTTERADEYETGEGRLISDYGTNAEYGDHEPVVEAVYAGNAPASSGPLDVSGRKRYGFPASRLRRLDPAERPATPVIGLRADRRK